MNKDIAKGLAIGLGAAIVAPIALAAAGSFGRPLARAAVKTGLLFYEKGRETAAELGEMMEDLVAEARAELEEVEAEVPAAGEEAEEAAAAAAGEAKGKARAGAKGETAEAE
jgi:hypothetical protein